MEKLAELQRKLGVAIDELNTDAVLADPVAYAAKETEINDLNGLIERSKAAQVRSANLARPVDATEATLAPAIEANFDVIAPSAQRGLDGRRAQQQFDQYLRMARSKTRFGFDASKHFRSFGEQLQAIMQHYVSRGAATDSRLVRAPTGAGEVDPTGGGFLVQVDFQEAVFMLAHDMGELLGRVNKVPISANANGIKINAVDETSRADRKPLGWRPVVLGG